MGLYGHPKKWGVCEKCKQHSLLFGWRVRATWKWYCKKCWRSS